MSRGFSLPLPALDCTQGFEFFVASTWSGCRRGSEWWLVGCACIEVFWDFSSAASTLSGYRRIRQAAVCVCTSGWVSARACHDLCCVSHDVSSHLQCAILCHLLRFLCRRRSWLRCGTTACNRLPPSLTCTAPFGVVLWLINLSFGAFPFCRRSWLRCRRRRRSGWRRSGRAKRRRSEHFCYICFFLFFEMLGRGGWRRSGRGRRRRSEWLLTA